MDLLTLTNKLKDARSQREVDNLLKSEWKDNNNVLFLLIEMSCDNEWPHYEVVTRIEGDDTGSEKYDFMDFYSDYLKLKKQEYEITNINDMANKCPVRLWNEVFRPTLMGKLHTMMPMEKIVKSIQTLTKNKNMLEYKRQKKDQ